MDSYAVVNTSTQIVENVVAWDGVSEYAPPENYILVLIDTDYVTMGWTYNGTFAAPVLPETNETAPNVIA